MLTVEHVGELLYRTLVAKTKDKDLRVIYERLALNERETAKCIGKEISAIDKKGGTTMGRAALRMACIMCGALSARQLSSILKNALKRRMYDTWFARYKDENKKFWLQLLRHERLQHDLLGPYWGR